MSEVAYKVEAFGGMDGEYPMGETTTPTAKEMMQVVDNLLDLIAAPGQIIRLTVTAVQEG